VKQRILKWFADDPYHAITGWNMRVAMTSIIASRLIFDLIIVGLLLQGRSEFVHEYLVTR
jgi:hypothetical protein